MVNGLLEARGGGSTRERRERAAEACPSQAQAMEHSCSAHLLCIRLVCISTLRRACTWSSQMLSIHVTGADDERLKQRKPTGCLRNSAAQATSWFTLHSGRVGRAPSAIAANHGSRSNRNNKRDLDHLCLDLVHRTPHRRPDVCRT